MNLFCFEVQDFAYPSELFIFCVCHLESARVPVLLPCKQLRRCHSCVPQHCQRSRGAVGGAGVARSCVLRAETQLFTSTLPRSRFKLSLPPPTSQPLEEKKNYLPLSYMCCRLHRSKTKQWTVKNEVLPFPTQVKDTEQ